MTNQTKTVDAKKAWPERDSLMVNSVDKAFRVLRAFDGSSHELSLTEVSETTGLDMSATQRFTHSLVKLGYLVKHPTSKRFSLSPKSLEIGRSYLQSNPLVKMAMPYLLQLNKDTGETVNLTVLQGTDIIFILRFLSRNVFNSDVVVGTRMPAFCTSPGRAILSRLPEAEADAILAASNYSKFTSRTPESPSEAKALVEKAGQNGYAMQAEEYYFGDLSVASPILDGNGYPIGAVNIGGTASSYAPEEFEERFAPAVVSAARSLSRSDPGM